MNRQGRGRSAPRRTAPGRAGAPRPRPPARRPQRPDRPAPPQPRAPFEDEAPGYRDASGHVPPPRPGDRRDAAPKRKARGGGSKKARAGGPVRRDGVPEARKGSPGGFGPKMYFGAAALLGLIVLLGTGAVVALSGGEDAPSRDTTSVRIGKPAGNGLSPVSYSNSPSTSAYAGIASRSADAKPLTIEEAFPPSATTLTIPDDADVKMKLRAKRLDADCAAAVWGATVGDVLGKGGCTQAARGIYSDTGSGYALAVAVFNLAGTADADRFVATLEKTLGGGFVRPLEAPAPLDGFGHGFGMARGLAMGHFAVVTWAQRLDGKGDEKDETLLSLLIEGGKAPAVLGRAARASN
ncbi:hypothetical protein E1264_12635 [Actinomadura sp. KC216]|uniref:hypothetical protein n=1 Tax=Actinomadura sp. KC216 TaxID=2530370 RepID=UPI001042ADA6|nr:hypothetical protein [Actinomadura sp. KC216]TDB88068.1 hypothetical protein E1264_12635 [Actinomadura sp. KC216]